jgi:hypothetical protein
MWWWKGDEHPRDQHTTHNGPNISADVWENLREIFADLDALNDRWLSSFLLQSILYAKVPKFKLWGLMYIHGFIC